MAHQYRITVTALPDAKEAGDAPSTMEFEVENHDDIFVVVQKLESRDDLPAGDAKALGVGLKLFGEVMLKNRNLPLFASFLPHFRDFMQQLKKK